MEKDIKDRQPKYLKLFYLLRQDILDGKIPFGQKLDTVRTAAIKHEMNSATVVSAYRQLEIHGFVVSRRGSGYYANYRESLDKDYDISSGADLIDLSSSYPHTESYPTRQIKQCIDLVIERDKAHAFKIENSGGYLPLREKIAKYLSETNNCDFNSQSVIIISGSQQGIDIISKALLYPGDYVITETPTYNGAIESFRSRGAKVIGAKLQEDGIDLEDLEKKIRLVKPKLLYVMTQFQNPTTTCYSIKKMQAILDLSKKYDFMILEDDSMSELYYDNSSPHMIKSIDKHDRVIYLKSFSKLLMPGLRIGAMEVPSSMKSIVSNAKLSTDISSSSLIQRALDEFMKDDSWENHLAHMKEEYKSSYQKTIEQVNELKQLGLEFNLPNGGLNFWIKLPKGISSEVVASRCLLEGVLINSSSRFYPNETRDKDSHIRISFSYESSDRIVKGMGVLKNVLLKMLDTN